MNSIILASASPRRKQLLKQIGLTFTIIPSGIDEKLNPRLKARRQAEVLSLDKARAVLKKVKEGIIIAADTLVSLEDDILVKPKDISDAKKTLRRLSGRMHWVITGFTIIDVVSKKTVTKSEETKVWFKNLNSREINSYIEKVKPFDFAGSYSIQGYGSAIVEKIDGDFFNVVGLPLHTVVQELRKFGIEVL